MSPLQEFSYQRRHMASFQLPEIGFIVLGQANHALHAGNPAILWNLAYLDPGKWNNDCLKFDKCKDCGATCRRKVTINSANRPLANSPAKKALFPFVDLRYQFRITDPTILPKQSLLTLLAPNARHDCRYWIHFVPAVCLST